MKQKFYSFIFMVVLSLIIFLIFNSGSKISEVVIFSSNLFLKNVFPSLFPMFIISSLLVAAGFPIFLGNLFSFVMKKIFKVKKEASFVFFMSMITGFPSSAKYISDLTNQNLIDENDGEKILLFTFFSNPLFIVNTVGGIFLNNIKFGYLILISHVLGNIVVGIILRNYNSVLIKNDKVSFKESLRVLNRNINNLNIFKILLNSIKDGISTLLTIYGIITTFLIIVSLFNINYDNTLSCFLIGIVEMTSGLKFLSLTNTNLFLKLILSCFLISFGGFSVHTQIMNILSEKKIKYGPFLLARLIHAFISVIILFLILIFQ